MAEDLEDTIRENAQDPRRASVDSGSVDQHSISEQIEADRYLASKQAVKSRKLGIRLTKLVPTGCPGDALLQNFWDLTAGLRWSFRTTR